MTYRCQQSFVVLFRQGQGGGQLEQEDVPIDAAARQQMALRDTNNTDTTCAVLTTLLGQTARQARSKVCTDIN